MTTRSFPTRLGLRGPILAGVAFLALTLVGTPAEAHDRHGHRHHKRGHGHGVAHGHVYHPARPAPAHRAFVVPARITRHDVGYYRPYYSGRVYHRPHRHVHRVYSFPVHTRYGWVYRPFHYCAGERFYADAPPPPRAHVRFDVRF
jgi:hypothetical protein